MNSFELRLLEESGEEDEDVSPILVEPKLSIADILKVDPQHRQPKDVQALVELVKDIKVFKEFQSNRAQLEELCKNLYLKSLPEGKTLFEQGDRGDSFYVILEGSVDILIRMQDEKGGGDTLKKVAALKKGDSFGDQSLLYGAPRNATVVTRETTDFIVMSKSTYDKVIKTH